MGNCFKFAFLTLVLSRFYLCQIQFDNYPNYSYGTLNEFSDNTTNFDETSEFTTDSATDTTLPDEMLMTTTEDALSPSVNVNDDNDGNSSTTLPEQLPTGGDGTNREFTWDSATTNESPMVSNSNSVPEFSDDNNSNRNNGNDTNGNDDSSNNNRRMLNEISTEANFPINSSTVASVSSSPTSKNEISQHNSSSSNDREMPAAAAAAAKLPEQRPMSSNSSEQSQMERNRNETFSEITTKTENSPTTETAMGGGDGGGGDNYSTETPNNEMSPYLNKTFQTSTKLTQTVTDRLTASIDSNTYDSTDIIDTNDLQNDHTNEIDLRPHDYTRLNERKKNNFTLLIENEEFGPNTAETMYETYRNKVINFTELQEYPIKWSIGSVNAVCNDIYRDCQYNLTYLSFERPPSIDKVPASTSIFLSYNNILKIPKKQFYNENIIRVYMDHNLIYTITDSIFHLNIQYINLEFNNISHISRSTFAKLIKLKYLNLAFNKVSSISPYTFARLLKLQYISLRFNPLTRIDSCAFFNSVITYLDLSDTQIYDVDFLQGFQVKAFEQRPLPILNVNNVTSWLVLTPKDFYWLSQFELEGFSPQSGCTCIMPGDSCPRNRSEILYHLERCHIDLNKHNFNKDRNAKCDRRTKIAKPLPQATSAINETEFSSSSSNNSGTTPSSPKASVPNGIDNNETVYPADVANKTALTTPKIATGMTTQSMERFDVNDETISNRSIANTAVTSTDPTVATDAISIRTGDITAPSLGEHKDLQATTENLAKISSKKHKAASKINELFNAGDSNKQVTNKNNNNNNNYNTQEEQPMENTAIRSTTMASTRTPNTPFNSSHKSITNSNLYSLSSSQFPPITTHSFQDYWHLYFILFLLFLLMLGCCLCVHFQLEKQQQWQCECGNLPKRQRTSNGQKYIEIELENLQ